MHATADTATRVLDAAAALFAEKGYSATTTRAIAQKAGVNEVTIFRRFGSKKGILAALGAQWSERMAGYVIERVSAPDDTYGTLKELATIEVRQTIELGTVAMRLALEATASADVAEIMETGPSGNFAGLAEYLAQRQEAGDLRADIDPRAMAESFFALTSQMVMSRQVLGEAGAHYGLPIEESTAQAFEIFWDGVRVRTTARKGGRKEQRA